MSAKIPSDQFLLYAFVDPTDSVQQIRDALVLRSRMIADLRLRIRAVPLHLDYPQWVRMLPSAAQISIHQLENPIWLSCCEAVAALGDTQLEAQKSPWHIHLFPKI
ncbi:MAG: wax ester/triacylglycerol synthase domain-containing protein, partial [Mycobacteriaceae bacterium]